MTARPFPLPSDMKNVRAASLLARAGAAHLKAFITGDTPERTAKAMFGDSTIIKAATTPAMLSGTSQWAASLGGVAVYDLVQDATTVSAAADLIDRGLKVTMNGVAELYIPGRTLTASSAGQWVSEGGAIPVRALNFSNSAILRPRKLAVISTYSRELAESSNIEAIVRATTSEAAGLALDLAMLSNSAGDNTKPAGLLYNIPPLTATAGGGQNALAQDLENLFAALATNGAGKTAVIIAAMPQAVRLMMEAGPKFNFDIIPSTALATGTVVVVEVASFVSGFSSVADFSVSRAGMVHLEDTTPGDFPAAPMKSLFQTDLIGLKMTLDAGWGMRAANHAAWLTGATW